MWSKQKKHLSLYNEPTKSSFSQKIFQTIEALLEKIVNDGKNGKSCVGKVLILKIVLLVPLFLLLFYSLEPLQSEAKKLIQQNPCLAKRRHGVPEIEFRFCDIFIAFIGAVASAIIYLEPYEKTRNFTNILASPLIVYPIALSSMSVFFYGMILLTTGIKDYDTLPLIGIAFAYFVAFFFQLLLAQRHSRLRFDPTKDNHSYIETTTTNRDTGLLRILKSSVFQLTIENVGQEAMDISKFNLSRISIKFALPKHTIFPGQTIELVPQAAPFEGECVRVPGIHCFGITDRACSVTTMIFPSSKERCDREHRHSIAELTVRYRNVERWKNETEF